MSTKAPVKYPAVVAKMTADEIRIAKKFDEEAKDAGPFGMLDEALQQERIELWHTLYKKHKLNPRHEYHFDLKQGVVFQDSGEDAEDTIQ